MIYAVIDTNVWVSALLTQNKEAATYQVLTSVFDRTITPLYNDGILAEYKEVLSRKKFSFTREKIDRVLSFIREHGIDTERTPFPYSMPDEDDRVFYEVSLSQEDSFLVTGNLKHYPRVPRVITPAEMIEILNQEES